jgi:GNAT superfamily N-acetyltransferase
MTTYSLRLARPDELRAVQEIERRAATRLAGVGLAAAADLPVQEIESLQTDCERGQLLVATDEDDHPVGFALFAFHEDAAHLEEIDVVPEHAGNDLGRRLIEAVVARAREAGLSRLTLTTFREVPFNAPFYARLGFRIVDEPDLCPRLARLRQQELRNGCELAPRVAMSREL